MIAGILSPTGSAHEVLRLCESGVVKAVLSRQVLVEADQNLSKLLPAILPEYRVFLTHLALLIVEDPSISIIEKARTSIHQNDALILAVAIDANVDYLVTWNTRHFQKPAVRDYAQFAILTPGECLEVFR